MNAPRPAHRRVRALFGYALFAGALAASAQGSTAAAQQPGSDPPRLAAFPHDSVLFRMLTMDPGPALVDSVDAYEDRTRLAVNDTLADIAEDPGLHPLLRANATLLIGRRKDVAHFLILRPLLDAPDPRIRLAVVDAAQQLMPALREQSIRLLRDALGDPEPAVQVRALEGITDRDLEALREYVAGDPPAELENIAQSLIHAGERRGAPLVPDAAGNLRKTGPDGSTLIYTPVRSWPPDLSAGTLELVTPAGDRRTLGEAVEVARDVLPAFFSNDGSRIVYENARRIQLYDIGSGETIDVGRGIAPRPLPFTDDFIFAVPVDSATTTEREKTNLSYTLNRAPFSSDGPPPTEVISGIGGQSTYGVSGGASPVRWMRIVEDVGRFGLQGEGLQPVPLPDPFGGNDP